MEKKWIADWIGEGEDATEHSHAPLFEKRFSVDKSKYNKIIIYISGLGLFEGKVNGEKISDTLFDPGESNFGKTVYYVKYDITEKILDGENVISVILGNGQYTNFIINPTMEKDWELIEPHRYQKHDGKVCQEGIYGAKKMIAEIYGDDELLVKSDESWMVTKSAVTFQNWYGGEDYDATWKIGSWDNAHIMTPPAGELKERFFTPIKIVEEFNAVSVRKNKDRYIVDFGKNGAGFVRLNLDTNENMRGIKIEMLPGEELTEDGFADQRSSTQSWCETKKCEIKDCYTIKGSGKESWQPKFCYHGFRYMEVKNFPYEPDVNTFTYCRIMTANEHVGVFETDNEILNKINELTDRSIESNMFGSFTDCPQIEKLGWLETSHLMFNSMAYGWDIKNWIPKIVNDMADSSDPDGYMPAIVPPFQLINGLDKDVNWGGACIMTPWYYYEFYNDKKVLYCAKEAGAKYIEYLEGHMASGLLSNYSQMGDWGQINENTPTVLVENCGFYLLLETYGKSLEAMGEDPKAYYEKAERLKKAFHDNKICYNKITKAYGNESQASYGCVLFSGIVKEENIDISVERLVEAVEKTNYHLTSGEVGLKQVFATLNKYERDDVVYKMVVNDTAPSYKYFVDKNLTCLPEYWNFEELWWGMVRSRNHAMMGHVKEWLVKGVLGIRPNPSGIVTIKPFVPENTTWAKGSIQCGKGKIEVNWKLKANKKIKIEVKSDKRINVKICPPEGYELEE